MHFPTGCYCTLAKCYSPFTIISVPTVGARAQLLRGQTEVGRGRKKGGNNSSVVDPRLEGFWVGKTPTCNIILWDQIKTKGVFSSCFMPIVCRIRIWTCNYYICTARNKGLSYFCRCMLANVTWSVFNYSRHVCITSSKWDGISMVILHLIYFRILIRISKIS